MIKVISLAFVLLAISGCAGREFVREDMLGAEINRYAKMADDHADRSNKLETARAAVRAARRAYDSGNTERAQVELQVAILLLTSGQ